MSAPARTPYGVKGSGHSGSDTSRERQQREDADGTTAWRQEAVREAVRMGRSGGKTCGELEREMNAGHGAISAALSVLHRDGTLVRLTERRNRQQVYVMPGYASADRERAPFRPRFNVNRLDAADILLMEAEVREAFTREAAEATGTPPSRLAVRAVLDVIRGMTP